jgi:hypothetical protein
MVASSTTLTMEAAGSSETFSTLYHTAWHHISEDKSSGMLQFCNFSNSNRIPVGISPFSFCPERLKKKLQLMRAQL